MKGILQVALLFILCNGFVLAQADLNLSDYGSIKSIEKDIEPFTDGFHTGLNVLTYTDASAPDVFGIGVMLYAGGFLLEANEDIGISKDDEGFLPATIGLQLSFGTYGFRGFFRYFPALETDNFSIDAMGFGLQYDISDLIPIPAFPSTSVYADYNTQTFKLSGSTPVEINPGGGAPPITGEIESGVEMGFSSFNIGAIVGYDLVILGVYGRAGMEFGNTALDWNSAIVSNGVIVPSGVSGDIGSTSFRYAVGLSLLGIKAEIGGRGGNISLGAGYGISF